MADHAVPDANTRPVQALSPRQLAVPWLAVAALAAVIFAEKLWRYGKPFAQAVGVVLMAIGVLAIWFPWFLPGLHASGMPTM